jgi:hypothetical protein
VWQVDGGLYIVSCQQPVLHTPLEHDIGYVCTCFAIIVIDRPVDGGGSPAERGIG